MIRSTLLVAVLLLIAQTTTAAPVGSNTNPLSFGKDQTIVDVGKVEWSPLSVEGLPPGAEIAVLRGDLAKGEAEALLRFPAGYKVPNHSHTSDELYMWISGAFTLVSHDGVRTAFAGPTYISFPGNAPPHALECDESAPCVLYLRLSRPFDIQYFPEPPAKR